MTTDLEAYQARIEELESACDVLNNEIEVLESEKRKLIDEAEWDAEKIGELESEIDTLHEEYGGEVQYLEECVEDYQREAEERRGELCAAIRFAVSERNAGVKWLLPTLVSDDADRDFLLDTFTYN